MFLTFVVLNKGNAVNTGTASAQGKEAALYTSHHYGNKYVRSKYIYIYFFSLVVQPLNFQGNSLTRKVSYVDKYLRKLYVNRCSVIYWCEMVRWFVWSW